ncbi:MAG TPA: serine/threonine-protein kinase, partial [Gemmataceae bacterium]
MVNAPGEQLDAILDRQRHAWCEGNRPTVEELLADSDFRDHPELQLDLIYNEIVLREELGERPTESEYAARYPRLQSALERQFEVHRAVHDRRLTETAHLNGPITIPSFESPLVQLESLLPDYELIERIGHGGMGVVYKARQRRLNRFAALKMFQPGRIPTDRELLRFQAEAEAIARLQHRNIVQIFDVGQVGELPFLALELVDGGTLADRLRQLPFAPRAAAELIQTLAEAVQHAHERHIIHRDLKPTNVLFADDGTPKLTDFGLAKLLESEGDSPRDATRTGDPIGTPRYMAPEQAAGQVDLIGPATDVYGLGTLLYESLTAQVPFVSSSVVETLERIRSEEPRSPRRLQAAIPRDLETICLHCLHKEPRRRYSSAQELADDLGRFLRGEPIAARPVSTSERFWKWCKRRPAQAALIGIAILAVLASAAAAGFWEYRERERVADLRVEVDDLVHRGQEALAVDEIETAQERFREAWRVVQGEDALAAYRTGVAGWLDHSLRAANRQAWKQRTPPREYDERRDNAIAMSLLLDGSDAAAIAGAREAIAAALAFTLADDAAWQCERELLAILDAAMLERMGN